MLISSIELKVFKKINLLAKMSNIWQKYLLGSNVSKIFESYCWEYYCELIIFS